MNHKLESLAGWYTSEQLDIDKIMIGFRFNSNSEFFTGKTCLEIGPADGVMSSLLKNEFESLHLLEGSQTLLNQIPDYPNVKKFCSMVEDFESTEQYDTIILEHVLEHIEHPQTALRKIKKWLKPGGRFIVGVPNALSFHRMIGVKMGLLATPYSLNDRDKELGHYRVYDPETLQKELRDAGFDQLIHSGGVFFKCLSNKQIHDFCTPEMIEGFYQLGKDFQKNAAEIFVVVSH